MDLHSQIQKQKSDSIIKSSKNLGRYNSMKKTYEEKVIELVNKIKSFQKTRYCKADIEAELRALQRELLCLVFDEEHVLNANLKIWDAFNQLVAENEEKGGVATELLEVLREDCKMFSNAIRAEISGNWGENQVFHRLTGLKGKHSILRNIELSDETGRTELDLIVLTEKAQIIVEVKNTKKDVFIDETGNYYRKGEYQSFDCNIKEKMNYREALLSDVIRERLQEKGKETNIIKLVVFTNYRMEIRNKCDELLTCFLGELPYIIDDYNGECLYSEEEIYQIAEDISDSAESTEYKYEMDMQKFKEDFARVLVTLENFEEQQEEETVPEQENQFEIPYFLTKEYAEEQKKIKKIVGTVVGLASVFGLGVTFVNAVSKVRR